MSARYAIYFSPARGSAWWRFGAGWLGRDETDNTALAPDEHTQLAGLVPGDITQKARRYGFHATLKAPFGLKNNVTPADLLARTKALAEKLRPVMLSPLTVVVLDNFVALVPAEDHTAVTQLASDCVTALDDLRRPLSEDDLARRRADTLDERGLALLQHYGYPHVLERFRMHFTLTDAVEPTVAALVRQAVAARVGQLNAQAPLMLDRLCIFEEAAPGQALRRLHDVVLAP